MDLENIKRALKGSQLKKTLKEKKVSQYRLAKDLGISQMTIYNWTKGIGPSDELAIKAGKYLGLIKPDMETKEQLRKKIKELEKEVDRLG